MKKLFEQKQNKFKNKKESRIINKEIVWFDSKREAKRYDDLYLLLKANKISNLILLITLLKITTTVVFINQTSERNKPKLNVLKI